MASPSNEEVMNLAEEVADRMGRAAALYKYALDAAGRGDNLRAVTVASQIPQEWVPYLHDLEAVGRAANS